MNYLAIACCMLLITTYPIVSKAQAAGTTGGTQAKPGVTYVPPLRGAPSRRVGGSSRGTGQALPQVAAMVPDHVGLTTAEQPVLYWFISKPTRVRVDITLIDENSIQPLLELPVTRIEGPAIHALDLAKHGIRLEKGTEYQWSVSLVPDAAERSGDVISGGVIKRVDMPPALRAALEQAGSAIDATQAYARAGIWYDALQAISRAIDKDPANGDLRAQRAALSEQAGLVDTARFDRGE